MAYNTKEKQRTAFAKWYKKNKERQKATVKAYQPGYRATNRDTVNANARAWRVANPDKVRAYEVKGNYGLSLFDLNRMADSQGWACAICGGIPEDQAGKGKTLAVDHCHATDKVRGLLCRNCNVGLGAFNDSLGRLRAAMQYLLYRG